jgi:hypothetical protein
MVAVVAASFTWLGMVLAISFLEAPLKFRAPGVSLPIGLGIGRLVFRALNRVELVLLGVIAVALAVGAPPAPVVWTATVPAVLLVVQLVAVRPALTRRSDQVLAGADGPRSRAHLVYVGLEAMKVIALVALGLTSAVQ